MSQISESTLKENEKQSKIREKIDTEEDFVNCLVLGNSLSRVVETYPNGISNEKIARMLMVEEEDVEKFYQSAILKIRTAMDIKEE